MKSTKTYLLAFALFAANASAWAGGAPSESDRSFAIKRVVGNGSRAVYIFEDPLCSACKALDVELQRLKNVTVYSFLVPVVHKESATASVDIYCSTSPGLALSEFYILGKYPTSKSVTAECTSKAKGAAEFAKIRGISRTPTIIFPSGKTFEYVLSSMKIEQELSSK